MDKVSLLIEQVKQLVRKAGSNVSSTDFPQTNLPAIPEALSLKEARSAIKQCNAVLAEHRRRLSSTHLTPKNK
jgi:hypothetical protein